MAGKKDTFLSGKLGPFSVGQQDRGGVCLESSDGLGLACLSHHVHSLQGTHTEDVHVLVNKRGQRLFIFLLNKHGQRMFIFWSTTLTENPYIVTYSPLIWAFCYLCYLSFKEQLSRDEILLKAKGPNNL